MDSFLIREARRYDLRSRAEIGALRKYYFIDTGLRNACLNFAFPDEGQMLQTLFIVNCFIMDILLMLERLIQLKKHKWEICQKYE